MTLAPGTRVRLVAPSPTLELASDTGTVVGPGEWDGYVLIRMDEPVVYHGLIPVNLETIREAEGNLEVIG